MGSAKERAKIVKTGKGITAYLLIAFGGAWLLWALLAAAVPPTNPLFQLAILPGAFAPALGTFVVRKWVTREGFADNGLKPNLRRWRYYLLGLLWPLVAAVVMLAVLFGIGDPDFTLRRALGVMVPGEDVPTLPPAL